MGDALNMSVSQVFGKGEKKYAFIYFSDDTRTAEGTIPDCKIISNKGFSSEEVEKLEAYMQRELAGLKKMAAGVNVVRGFMKDGEENSITG